MQGMQFVVNEDGEPAAVVIDLSVHGELWEDFHDFALATVRTDEPRDSLDEVRREVREHSRLS